MSVSRQALAVGLVLLAALSCARAQDQSRIQAQALAAEQADLMPATSFYDTPSPLPAGWPGQLIRSQVVGGYTLPGGMRAVRILYHSRSASGGDVPASGVVLLPTGHPPAGGWPVIAWAHGTSGVARVCAPSMMKDLYDATELLPMIQAGFAVVIVDYAGLGTDVPHQYLSFDAQARDVVNGVKAARGAVANLSPRWVVDGHSQGGGAAWFVAQQRTALRDPNFLGAVSVAGAMNMPWLIHYMAMSVPDSFNAVFLAYGIKARFPRFNVADVLSQPALAQYRAMTTKGCERFGQATQRGQLLGKSAIRPRVLDNPWMRRFLAQDAAFARRPTRPLLVLAGGADHTVPPQSIRRAAAKACRLGYRLEFRELPGLHHVAVMDESIPYQLRWIRARFAGRPAPDNCAALTGS